MARAEDVVVSDRLWRWTSAPNGVLAPRPDPFVIVEVDGRTVRYRYTGENRNVWGRSVDDFLAHAEPDPLPAPSKCEPGCTPAHPCWTSQACPAFNEPSAAAILTLNRDYALIDRREALRRIDREREPIELRCGRDLACGLFRVT